MSVCIQIENAEGKRMCVYSERDFDYMVKKGWRKYVAPAPDPEPVIAATLQVAEEKPAKRRGRPARAH